MIAAAAETRVVARLVEVEDENGQVRYYADCVAEEEKAKPAKKNPKPLTTDKNLVQVGSDGPFGRTL